MSQEIARITRGGITECILRGDIAVVDAKGSILYFHGDPRKESFIRSAAKPLQTLEVFRRGAADRYKFNNRELSIMCGSHYGEGFHTKTVLDILDKLGLPPKELKCGEVHSMKPSIASKQLKTGVAPSPLFSCCSGKHSGMLSICENMGWEKEGYYREEHPVQQGMLETVAHMCSMKIRDIGIGIDGCGVPVFSMPIYNMALAYARFSAGRDPLYGEWSKKIYNAMAQSPEMLAGTRGFCSDLTRVAGGRFVAKLGADGIYCIGVRDLGIGIALKIESGGVRSIPPVVMDILKKLKLIDREQERELDRYRILPNKNHLGDEVGQIFSTVDLQPYL